MGLQRVGHNLATKQEEVNGQYFKKKKKVDRFHTQKNGFCEKLQRANKSGPDFTGWPGQPAKADGLSPLWQRGCRRPPGSPEQHG